jgi:hypothetical protein
MTGDMSNFGDFEAIPAVVEKSAGRFGDNELSFAFPEVLEVIQLCSVNQIAVLGVELFKVREDGLYQTEKLTDYDLRMKQDPAIKQELARVCQGQQRTRGGVCEAESGGR